MKRCYNDVEINIKMDKIRNVFSAINDILVDYQGDICKAEACKFSWGNEDSIKMYSDVIDAVRKDVNAYLDYMSTGVEDFTENVVNHCLY